MKKKILMAYEPDVMGTHDLETAKRWLLGAVGTHVTHHAPCDVLVVK